VTVQPSTYNVPSLVEAIAAHIKSIKVAQT
jgi:hypothetical protein